MITVDKSYDMKIVLALGLFDSVHIGHVHLLNEARKLATSLKSELAVFTFRNNPFSYYGQDKGMVFSFSEREDIFKSQNIDVVIAKEMNEDYVKISPLDFLDDLFSNFNILGVVCGADFTFGYKGQGNVDLLKEYANRIGIRVNVVPYILTETGEKVSSNLIRKYLNDGLVEQANNLMGRPYKISGTVVHSHGRGHKFGFPTANINVPDEKAYLSSGVYATSVCIDGIFYDAITNIGTKPTFDDYTVTVESYIINFCNDVYNKNIQVYFYKKIRNIIKFNTEAEIHNQIEKDLIIASGIKRSL